MKYAIKISGFAGDKGQYLPCADSEEIELFPTKKDAEEELAYIAKSGLAPIGDCVIEEYKGAA